MKKFHYRLILSFYIVSLIAILAMGSAIIYNLKIGAENETLINTTAVITFITAIVLSIVSIIIAIISYKKSIIPMAKMLDSSSYDSDNKFDISKNDKDDLSELATELHNKLIEANRRINQTETILQHMTDGVISFDMDGNVTYINPEAKDLLELKDTDNTFNKIFDKYTDVDNMEKIIYLEDWTSSEKKVTNNRGSMDLFFVAFKDEINRPTGLMVVVQDITEHVKLDNMRKEFVADVSHELKTPLTSIEGFSETLLDGVDDKETQEHFLHIINDNAIRMQKLVQDLLTLSKYDSKRNMGPKTKFDLGELSKSCAEKFEIEVKKKGQHLQCITTADVPPVYADKDGIERVIINIISNSVKYTQDGGTIDVYVGYVHDDAYVKIKDNGIGIPKADLQRIYERFYRVDKARSRQLGGTGLGLSIAKEIIEQNDGSINISSETGSSKHGTEVIVKIPVAKE